MPEERAEELLARFLELAPEGFEERRIDGEIELVAFGEAAARVAAAYPDATASDVADGWEDRWREFHHGITIGPLWVGPPWEAPPPGLAAVVIDPGRAFGTGAHATTRLCLELLLEQERSSLLDIGCGSGVLGIAASLVGFGPVTAVDVDPIAVEVTIENAAVNGVTIDASVADAKAARLPHATVAVANIALREVEGLAPVLDSPVAITSGYLVSEFPVLAGYERAARREIDGWAADLLLRI